MEFIISVSLDQETKGILRQVLNATDPHDNEENAKRVADQMITELFRRWRFQKQIDANQAVLLKHIERKICTR